VIGWLLVKTALIIGDSHVDPSAHAAFGQDLAALLIAQGYVVTQAGVGATSARMWATQNPVCNQNGRCVNKQSLPQRPDLLVISLGTNDAANAQAGGASVASAVADVERVVQQLAPKRAFWVGPPWMRGNVAFYTPAGVDAFYNAADNSSLDIFDSRSVTQQAVMGGSGDGVHLTGAGAQQWANAVANKIKSTSTSATAVKVAIGLGVVATLAVLWRKGIL
jgi:lysophospholipase L1-like esterase